MNAMSTLQSPKQATLQALEKLDDDTTYADIMYEIYVLEKIERGFKDVDEGRVVSHEEARSRLSKWLR